MVTLLYIYNQNKLLNELKYNHTFSDCSFTFSSPFGGLSQHLASACGGKTL